MVAFVDISIFLDARNYALDFIRVGQYIRIRALEKTYCFQAMRLVSNGRNGRDGVAHASCHWLAPELNANRIYLLLDNWACVRFQSFCE